MSKTSKKTTTSEISTPLEELRKQRDEAVRAIRLMTAHYDDLSKNNRGWMGKMCLNDYALWNEALLSMEKVLREPWAVKS